MGCRLPEPFIIDLKRLYLAGAVKTHTAMSREATMHGLESQHSAGGMSLGAGEYEHVRHFRLMMTVRVKYDTLRTYSLCREYVTNWVA